MTKTRVIAALIMAPLAICAIVLLPTQWLAALAAILFLTGLWEWLKLSGIDDSLPRTVLLMLNLLLMVLMVWASAGSMVLFQIAALVGVVWWLLALLWLRFFTFGADHGNGQARALKLAAGTLAVLPAWAALVLLHANPDKGNLWLLTALTMVWAADRAPISPAARSASTSWRRGSAPTRPSKACSAAWLPASWSPAHSAGWPG